MDLIKMFVIVGLFSYCSEGSPLMRNRRFLTPTTYPVPTKPYLAVTPDLPAVLTGSILLQSTHVVNCPVKRSVRHKRVILDQDIMRKIYLELLGDYDKRMMAESLDEADQHFIHLPYRGNGTSSRPVNDTLKRTLLDDIETFNRWYNNTLKNLNYGNNATTMDNKSLAGLLQELDITLSQLQQILGIRSDMDLVTKYRPVYERKRRASDSATGSNSIKQFCVSRGSDAGDGFLHMCTACALTTQLPADRYPSVINEATCDTIDCKCFMVNGSPHGKCKPIIHHVKMLRRKSTGCRLLIQNGTQVFLDNWELYDQPVRVGCECEFDKRSLYAPFVQMG